MDNIHPFPAKAITVSRDLVQVVDYNELARIGLNTSVVASREAQSGSQDGLFENC